jgi:exodeoxyribonuclease VII large subunit
MPDAERPMTSRPYSTLNSQAWTVSELTDYIRDLLDSEPALQDVWLTGEISNFLQARSGHLYFTLKDASAELACVMWRSEAARLTWQPEQGAAALAHGRISVYPARGAYQH